jgi:DNA-binding transcriptional LysR family regulator
METKMAVLLPVPTVISMELDSTEGLLSAVEAGLGITFVSKWAVRNQLSGNGNGAKQDSQNKCVLVATESGTGD